jgi:hypothetical protein
LGRYIRNCTSNSQSTNADSSIFNGNIEGNEQPEEWDFKWEFKGLAKVMVNEEPDLKIVVCGSNGNIECQLPMTFSHMRQKCFGADMNLKIYIQSPRLYSWPHCKDSNDKDSDFGDHEALMPALMSKYDTTLDSDGDDDSIPKLCLFEISKQFS